MISIYPELRTKKHGPKLFERFNITSDFFFDWCVLAITLIQGTHFAQYLPQVENRKR
jgi:hypothetical protein